MRRLTTVLAVMVLALAVLAVPVCAMGAGPAWASVRAAGLQASAWPMFGHDVQHSGRSLYSDTSTGTVEWTFATGGPSISSPVLDASGTIYVQSLNNSSLLGTAGKLRAIGPDGTQKWAVTNTSFSTPAIDSSGTLWVGGLDGGFAAFSPSGTRLWSYMTGGPIFLSSAAIDATGNIYVGSWDSKLYAFNPDRTRKWTFRAGDWISSSPAVGADGTVYFGCEDGRLYAVDASGTLKWSYPTDDEVESSPAIDASGTIYVAGAAGNLFAINPDGTLKWSYGLGAVSEASPAIGADGTIYIGSDEDAFYALNPADGTLKWSYRTGGGVDSAPAIGADGTIYVTCEDGNLYALSPAGTLVWSYPAGAGLSTPAIGADGTLYVAGDKLYAFGGPAPAMAATYFTIRSSAGSVKIGKQVVLAGFGAPSPSLVGATMHVDVKKPGKKYWSYSSNRLVYAGAGGVAAWQYKYTFKRGLAKGTYEFRAVFSDDATHTGSTSALVKVVVK